MRVVSDQMVAAERDAGAGAGSKKGKAGGKGGGKKGGKKKGGWEEGPGKKDPTADRTLESLYAELCRYGVATPLDAGAFGGARTPRDDGRSPSADFEEAPASGGLRSCGIARFERRLAYKLIWHGLD